MNLKLVGRGLALLACLGLAACGSNTVILKREYDAVPAGTHFKIREVKVEIPENGEKPPDFFVAQVQSYLKAELSNAQAYQDDDPAAWQVDVRVVSYRMRGAFTRAFFGVLAGKDGIDSQVQVVDPTGKVLAESKVTSGNMSAVGDASMIAQLHAGEIARFVLAKKVNAPQNMQP